MTSGQNLLELLIPCDYTMIYNFIISSSLSSVKPIQFIVIYATLQNKLSKIECSMGNINSCIHSHKQILWWLTYTKFNCMYCNHLFNLMFCSLYCCDFSNLISFSFALHMSLFYSGLICILYIAWKTDLNSYLQKLTAFASHNNICGL